MTGSRFLGFIAAFLLSSCSRGVDRIDVPELLTQERGAVSLVSPHDEQGRLPLLIVLHGYKANAFLQSIYFSFDQFVSGKKFHLVYLNGTRDLDGHRFWNASSACCNLDKLPVDDVTYLASVIETLRKKIHFSKVYLAGHSNGGFMVNRFLCERPDLVDGVVSLAGSLAPSECSPGVLERKKVIQVYGSEDGTIANKGGTFRGQPPYLGVESLNEVWSTKLLCRPGVVTGEDYAYSWGGRADEKNRFECANGNQFETIRLVGSWHIPLLKDQLRNDILDALLRD